MVEARRPDIIFVDKQAKEAKIIDIALPGDARVKVPISSRRNGKVVEAEENDDCANCDWSIGNCIQSQAAQAHYMNADVTLACERCCVTSGYFTLFTKACMGCKRFYLKERKNVMFLNKSTYLIALLYSLLFACVSGRFEA